MTTPTTALDNADVTSPHVYLCGPIGKSPEKAAPVFAAAADTLRNAGLTVFNPMDHQDDESMGWHDYMRMELPVLMRTSGMVIVLPGWEDGVGSHVEVLLAVAMGIPVHKFDPEVGVGASVFAADAGRDAVASLLHASQPTLDVSSPANSLSDILSPDENLNELPHEEAARIVLGPRGAYYDHPLDNFARTGLMWSGVLYSKLKPGEVVDARDVALCMVGVKMARESFRHKRDNLVDGHGYLMTLDMVIEEEERRADLDAD